MSAELEIFLNLPVYNDSARIISSRVLCGVSFEHSESVRLLIGTGNFTSSLGVLRMQYESFAKAVWALYAASDNMISKLECELTYETEKWADKVPLLNGILKELEDKAPPQVTDQLLEFKEYSWKPLSSYIHGGIHAINRHAKGYPTELLAQAARSSNGLLVMTGMMLVVLSGDSRQQGKIPDIQRRFADCCPKLNPDKT
jgi:hypothetical protein